MAQLILKRKPFQNGAPTPGSFFFADMSKFFSLRIDCLELPWKNNAPRVSCIPPGTYAMRWTHSHKFGRMTWELKDVPNRSSIRIHSGNFAGEAITDSLGCLLPCLDHGDINGDGVTDGLSSRLATKQLEGVLGPYEEAGINIEIHNG